MTDKYIIDTYPKKNMMLNSSTWNLKLVYKTFRSTIDNDSIFGKKLKFARKFSKIYEKNDNNTDDNKIEKALEDFDNKLRQSGYEIVVDENQAFIELMTKFRNEISDILEYEKIKAKKIEQDLCLANYKLKLQKYIDSGGYNDRLELLNPMTIMPGIKEFIEMTVEKYEYTNNNNKKMTGIFIPYLSVKYIDIEYYNYRNSIYTYDFIMRAASYFFEIIMNRLFPLEILNIITAYMFGSNICFGVIDYNIIDNLLLAFKKTNIHDDPETKITEIYNENLYFNKSLIINGKKIPNNHNQPYYNMNNKMTYGVASDYFYDKKKYAKWINKTICTKSQNEIINKYIEALTKCRNYLY